jgi:segregation and condensation protein B
MENIENLEIETVEVEEESLNWEQRAAILTPEQRVGLVQSLLFAHGAPLAIDELIDATSLNREELLVALDTLQELSESDTTGLHVVKVAGRYQLRTKSEHAPFVHRIRAEKPKKLSRPALETLAIVAYKQPLTRSEVERIRGVDCTPTLKTLVDRNLIRIVGYHTSVGNPALYGTSDEFLHVFGLDVLADLPALRDVNLLESDPGELESMQQPEEQVEEGVASEEQIEQHTFSGNE